MATRCLLIGSGPGAMAAAEAIRAEDADARITMVSAEPEGYYSRPGLAYYLAREEPESRLFPFRRTEITELGIQTVTGRAVRVSRDEHRVAWRTEPNSNTIACSWRRVPGQYPCRLPVRTWTA